MIFIKSRYASEQIRSVTYPGQNKTTISVFRDAPKNINQRKVTYYRWKEGDRIDHVATTVFSDPELWWRIMDVNPEINDPHSIRPGDVIRIPK